MFAILLIIALLLPVPAFAESVNYTEIVTKWSHTIYPQESFTAQVKVVKPVLGASGDTGVLMVQVHYTYQWGIESVILILRGSRVLGWILAGTVEEEEEQEEALEVFSQKDAA